VLAVPPCTPFYFFFTSTTIGATPQCVSIKFIFSLPLKKKIVDAAKNYVQLHADNISPCIPFLSNLAVTLLHLLVP